MSTLTIPNNIAAGTPINSAPVDANFNAIATWANGNVDNSNIGALGLYASNLKPLTAAQATFGLTAVGVGYEFLANDATATPLTISGVSGQSADIFDVTLTSGGPKAMFLTAAGALNVGAAGQATIAGDGGFSRSATAGQITLGGAGGWGSLNFGSTAGVFTLNNSSSVGKLQLGPGSATGVGALAWSYSAGYATIVTSASLGAQTIVASLFGVLDNTPTYQLAVDTSGDLGILGTLHQASKRAAKKNIQDLTFSPLTVVVETKWQQYQLKHEVAEKQPHVGFIADDSSEWLGGKEKCYLIPSDLAGITAAAVAELTIKLRAAGIAV